MQNSIEQIKNIVLKDKSIVLRDGTSSKIKNIEFLGNHQCYDIEVENKDHLFLLNNGIITSNSKHTCLEENTLVRMADLSTKKIKDIKIGDIVLGSDKQGKAISVKVINHINQGLQPCYIWKFENISLNSDIIETVCTKEHKFLFFNKFYSPTNSGNEINYKLFPIGTQRNNTDIVLASKDNKNFYKLLNAQTQFVGNKQCFDITVDHPDHLFILANNLIVSNSGAYKGKKNISGLKYIEQFTESPETFADRASVAEEDGKVQKIEDAAQGGKYITINDKKIYVLPDMDINVKVGDEVEAGDILSDGLADPEDIVKYKGLGAGRKYWATRFKKLLEDSGGAASLRNTEVVARNILNKIEITDPDGFAGYLPGDIVSYNKIEENYQPRENSKDIDLKQNANNALNKYLEEPVLYYTIGTRVTKSMLKELKELGIDDIIVNDEPPGFEPVTIRMREAAMKGNEDWLSRMSSSYIKSNLIDAAARGLDTNINENTNPYARMGKAYDFGKNIEKGKF